VVKCVINVVFDAHFLATKNTPDFSVFFLKIYRGARTVIFGNCPAGRAHCAWGDHFVVGVSCLAWSAAWGLALLGG